MRSGIGSHQSARSESDEWLTPPEIIEELGPFDLDPCSPVIRPWETAALHYTREDNGLSKKWQGRVWLNPPYGAQTGVWLGRLSEHGNGIALIFARTETSFFHRCIWRKANAVLFLFGRLYFHHGNGERAKANSGGPSVLVAYGTENAERLRDCNIVGKFIPLVPVIDRITISHDDGQKG